MDLLDELIKKYYTLDEPPVDFVDKVMFRVMAEVKKVSVFSKFKNILQREIEVLAISLTENILIKLKYQPMLNPVFLTGFL